MKEEAASSRLLRWPTTVAELPLDEVEEEGVEPAGTSVGTSRSRWWRRRERRSRSSADGNDVLRYGGGL